MDKKLHILFLCGWYPSRVLPNNGDFIQRHAIAVSLLHKVTVFHIVSDKNCTKKIEIISTNIDGIKTHIAYVKSSKNPFKKIIFFFNAFNLLLKEASDFDIVHLNKIFPFGIFSLYLKKIKKIPFIISEHFTDYKYPLSKKISRFHKVISKIIVKNASFVCPVSKDLENSLIQFGLKGKYVVVENVVNTERFQPKETTNQVFSMLHISNMNDTHKNIRGLLKTIKKLTSKNINFHFKLIGENSDRYKAFSKKLGIDHHHIEFINHIPHHLVINYLQEANLFLLFSNYENLPCVILESFACGTPVIATDVGGIKEHFPSNFGTLIQAKDEKKLEEEILNCYHKKNKMASKKEMHTYVASKFSESVICNKFTSLYNKTLIDLCAE